MKKGKSKKIRFRVKNQNALVVEDFLWKNFSPRFLFGVF